MGNVKKQTNMFKNNSCTNRAAQKFIFSSFFFSSIEEIALIIIAVNSYIEDCIVFKQEKEVV